MPVQDPEASRSIGFVIESASSSHPGPEQVTCRMIVAGTLETDACLAFMTHYLNRLDLASTLISADPTQIEIELTGADVLVDMFEMANWLGPAGSWVDSVRTRSLP